MLVYYLAYFSTLKMEAVYFSETHVHFKLTTRRYIVEEKFLIVSEPQKPLRDIVLACMGKVVSRRVKYNKIFPAGNQTSVVQSETRRYTTELSRVLYLSIYIFNYDFC
jgi:hypothetical protein